jgi:hypothetical protein
MFGAALRYGLFPARTYIQDDAYSFSLPFPAGQGDLGEGSERVSAGANVRTLRSWNFVLFQPSLPSIELRRVRWIGGGIVSYNGAALAELVAKSEYPYYERKAIGAFGPGNAARLEFTAIAAGGVKTLSGIDYVFPEADGYYVLSFRTPTPNKRNMERVAELTANSFSVGKGEPR